MSWNGVGLENLKTAVCSSGVSTASRLAKTRRPRFCSGFQTLSAEKATSAEVNGLPSCQVTPSRSLKVTESPSAEPSQLVASRGARPSLPSKEASASGSTTLLATKNTPFEATIGRVEVLRLGIGRDDEAAAPPVRMPLRGRAVAAAKIAVLCSSARRVSEIWDMDYSVEAAASRQEAGCEFPIACSLARGMLFCTEPRQGKFLSAIGELAQIDAAGDRWRDECQVVRPAPNGSCCLRGAGRTGPYRSAAA